MIICLTEKFFLREYFFSFKQEGKRATKQNDSVKPNSFASSKKYFPISD